MNQSHDPVPSLFHEHARNLKSFSNAQEALEHIIKIYDRNIAKIQKAFKEVSSSLSSLEAMKSKLFDVTDATYPYLGIEVKAYNLNSDARVAFGATSEPGIYGTTLTRPHLFRDYYLEQISLLIKHHKTPVYVGESNWPIPLPFAIEHYESDVDPLIINQLQSEFILPNLSKIDDNYANGTYDNHLQPKPLSFFTGERVDFSVDRLHHYTGTSAEHFQRFILLTNYQRYVDSFIKYGEEQLQQNTEYDSLVGPGNYIICAKDRQKAIIGEPLKHLPQMPAYHLKRPDRNGITFINIGVGPSNAKNITDHLAVLRPHCWIMLGHCGGLRRSQMLGDYVLAHAYARDDHVLDQDLPLFVPIPPIAEVQVALQLAVANITGQHGTELKTRMRTGTIVTTDNRNWEFRFRELYERYQQCRAIAVDMESATVAANGFRFRVPYGTLLCVSDKPLHGELKLRGMAMSFYRERVHQHLQIGLETVKILSEHRLTELHSRKLRGFDDPPFR